MSNDDITKKIKKLESEKVSLALKGMKMFPGSKKFIENSKKIEKIFKEIEDLKKQTNEGVDPTSDIKIGTKKFTEKNLTPVDILQVAFAYSKAPEKDVIGGKGDKLVKILFDLEKLTGQKFNLTTKRLEKGSKPALVLPLLKNKLVKKDEYIELYKTLISRLTKLGKKIATKGVGKTKTSGSAKSAAMADMNETKQMANFTPDMLKKMKADWDKLKTINPTSEHWKRVEKLMNSLPDDVLRQIIGEKIKFLNILAKNILRKRGVKEGVINEAEETYFDTYSQAIKYALKSVEKKGFIPDEDDVWTYISVGSKKPSEGKTTKIKPIALTKKNGGKSRKYLHIQVYGMKNKYELNYYIS